MLCDLIGYQTIKRGCSRSILFWIDKSAPLNRCQTLTRWPRSHSIQFHPIFEAEIPREEIESNGEETANKKIRNTRFVYIYIYGGVDESIGSREPIFTTSPFTHRNLIITAPYTYACASIRVSRWTHACTGLHRVFRILRTCRSSNPPNNWRNVSLDTLDDSLSRFLLLFVRQPSLFIKFSSVGGFNPVAGWRLRA